MGTLSLAAPLVLFEKSRLWASTGFHLLPSFHHHHHPTQHIYTTQTVTRTVIQAQLYTVHYTDTRSTRNVICPSGAWLENWPHSTPSICLARNPKHVIMQWVGIETNKHYVRNQAAVSVLASQWISPQKEIEADYIGAKNGARFSETDWFQSPGGRLLRHTGLQKLDPRYDKCLNPGAEYVEKYLKTYCICSNKSFYLIRFCFCKRPQINLLCGRSTYIR